MLFLFCRTREQVRAEEDLQQITVELKPKCDIEIVVPDVAAAGEAASLACATMLSAAAAEVETASQASEPASQASDEEELPIPDIYFVSHLFSFCLKPRLVLLFSPPSRHFSTPLAPHFHSEDLNKPRNLNRGMVL
ncbi:phosphatidylinositol 4-phosphate 5-kinase type-1 gamma-like [Python bivittatus]|uniref:Phosphatidylinositol 4-phosphate 5-kinase type-1 gamma-like n=1 Tax=Python bivittatus TaxID=176946 RepID=A0A9F5JD79_PYTBI|nr:phosphatidylinositol 4-phosphate 5-kinase type-1 gamma-like [Python bivittatus]